MPRATYMSLGDFFGTLVRYSDLDPTLQHDLLTAQAFIALDIAALREIATADIQALAAHGGLLAGDSTPSLKRVNVATDKSLRVAWAASNVDEVQFPPIPWPPDLNPACDVIVHLLLQRSTGTNACQIDVHAFEGVGDTEMGDKTPALDSTAVTEVTVTLSASDIAGHPGVLNLSLVPDAHTTDALYLYGAWIEYTRALRTS